MKDIIARMTAIANADAATPKKSLTESRGFRGVDGAREDDEGHGRPSFGKRDWDSEAEDTPHDKFLAYKAKGGKLTRSQWEEDRDNGVNEAKADPTGSWIAYKSPTEFKKYLTRDGAKKKVAASEGWKIASSEYFYDTIKKKGVTEGQFTQHGMPAKKPGLGSKVANFAKKVTNKVAPGDDELLGKLEKDSGGKRPAKNESQVDESPSAGAMGRAAEREFGGYGQQASPAPAQAPQPTRRPTAPAPRKYLVKDPSGKVVGTYANAPEAVAARKKMRNPDSYSIVKEGVKRGRRYEIVTEAVKFKVNDPRLAKVLRRFPKEVADFKAGAELGDDLYDALFDHYCNNGEMPYGIAKARTGDPYEWVANKLGLELAHGDDSELAGLVEGKTHEDPAIRAILDKYPYEAKQFETFGELDDGPLYHELFDHYLDSGEMPYGIAKAHTGDPLQWVAEQVERDLGIDAPPTGDDTRPEYDSAEELSSHEDYEPPMEGMGGDIMPMEDIGDETEMPATTPIVPRHDMSLPSEDSVDPTMDAGHVLVEEDDEAEITSTLSEVGLDEGLDFFFENGELVVIGKSTATVAINALKGKFKASVSQVDGEEVRMNVSQIGTTHASAPAMPALGSITTDTPVTENVNLNITADGEDDVLAIIRKLSGLNSESLGGDDESIEIEMHPQVSTMGDMAGLTSAMDSFSVDHDDAMDYENDLSAIVSGEDHDGVMDEAEYANSPEPEVHTSTTQMINQGNDLNRPKKMYARAQPGDNPMAVRPMDEARRLMSQYEAMKRDVKSK